MSTKWQNHLLAGGAAGAIECLALHPIDVAKTRQQLQITYRQTMLEIVKTIVNEGGGGLRGYLRVYRGVLSPLLGMMPKSAVWLATNERLKYWMIGKHGKETTPTRLFAGFFSGWPEALVVTPFDSIKIKLQSRRFASQYKNSWDCFKSILASQGIQGLFKGFEATVWRNGTWNALYFANVGYIKDTFVSAEAQEKRTNLARSMVSFAYGTTAGLIATTVNTPLDLVKSRIQLGVHDEKYRWTWQTLFLIAKEEGATKLWRGLPLRLIRMGLGGGITMSIYELVIRLLQERTPKESDE